MATQRLVEAAVSGIQTKLSVPGEAVEAAAHHTWRRGHGGVALVDLLAETVAKVCVVQQGRPAFCFTDPELLSNLRGLMDPALVFSVYLGAMGVNEVGIGERHFSPCPPDADFLAAIGPAEGVVETHMHASAALTSELAWCWAFAGSEVGLAEFAEITAPDFDRGGPHGRSLATWFLTLGVARAILLRACSLSIPGSEFCEFAVGEVDAVQRSPFLRGRVSGLVGRSGRRGQPAVSWDAATVESSEPRALGVLLKGLRRRHHGRQGTTKARPPAFSLRAALAAERRMIVWAVRESLASRRAGSAAIDLEALLLQYVRGRAILHRHYVVQGGRVGLERLRSRFAVAERTLGGLLECDQDSLAVALDRIAPASRVGRVEARFSPGVLRSTAGDAAYSGEACERFLDAVMRAEGFLREGRDLVRELREPGRGQGRRLGIIFHFIKRGVDERRVAERGSLRALLGSARRKRVGGVGAVGRLEVDRRWRFGSVFASALRDGLVLYQLWSSMPELGHHLVGFDVAGDEMAVPNWVYVAVLGHLRRVANIFALRSGAAGRVVPHFTYHAGESFLHLVSGIRCVDEALQFLEVGQKPRIGHALAVAPGQRPRGSVPVANEQRGMDLCWAMGVTGAKEPRESVAMLFDAWIRNLHGRVAWPASIGKPTGEELCAAFKNMSDCGVLRAIGYPWKKPQLAGLPPERALVAFLLSDPVYGNWAKQTTYYDDIGTDACDALRVRIAERLAQKGIVIEACPSSNAALGDVTLAAHPALCEFSEAGSPRLRVSLNTDDPLQFATDLLTEYWLMFSAKRELSDQHTASQWIAQRRSEAFGSCFLDGKGHGAAEWTAIWKRWSQVRRDPGFAAAIGAPAIRSWFETE